MKKRVMMILLLIVSTTLWGNDGWFLGVKGASGELYAEGEHFAISMEEELLSYEPQHGGIDIFYQFKNQTKKSVTVDAAFPVEFIVPIAFDPKTKKIKEILPKAIGDVTNEYGIGGLLKKLNKQKPDLDQVIIVDFKGFMALQKGIHPAPIPYFEMKQDGKNVEINKVLIERKKLKDGIRVVIHFQHKLTIAGDHSSELSVRYDMNNKSSSGMDGDHRYWNYLLGSARGWQGAIKKVYLVLPAVAKFQNEKRPATITYPKAFKEIGRSTDRVLLYAENYEPEFEDRLNVETYHTLVIGKGTPHHKLIPFNTQKVNVAPQNLLSDHFKKHISTVDYFHHEGFNPKNMKVALKLVSGVMNGNIKRINQDYSKEILMLVPAKVLRYMRNMIIAQYGYRFKDDLLVNFYKRFKWYQPKKIKNIPLTKAEKARVALIKSIELLKK